MVGGWDELLQISEEGEEGTTRPLLGAQHKPTDSSQSKQTKRIRSCPTTRLDGRYRGRASNAGVKRSSARGSSARGSRAMFAPLVL